ncbi:unnamed protein product [Vicia faba]|uniref:Uncharacterized protein n=1 Tax=Vicia faba TaxID=3906 RepID=A0AAV1ARL2_VICFA|nr:unnamed protein product [Vicia faba]
MGHCFDTKVLLVSELQKPNGFIYCACVATLQTKNLKAIQIRYRNLLDSSTSSFHEVEILGKKLIEICFRFGLARLLPLMVLADLPVAKGIGTPSIGSLVRNVGRRSRRQLGERVHFCVRCDFPIAIYGRLSPCDHAFCLDCARSDSLCYL